MAGYTDMEADLICANVEVKTLRAEIEQKNKEIECLTAAAAAKAAEMDEVQKAFALACRFIFDHFDCPAVDADANFLECYGELDDCGTVERWECWQRHFREKVQSEQVCRVCGCTEDNACPGGCWWVEEGLCSSCAGESKEGRS